ncbi:hypothetical protein CY35_02G195500 [Sphagnum magellanicum]|nr:hypothetical protein CY35_02G195500 [Sphagnum magellanicum]
MRLQSIIAAGGGAKSMDHQQQHQDKAAKGLYDNWVVQQPGVGVWQYASEESVSSVESLACGVDSVYSPSDAQLPMFQKLRGGMHVTAESLGLSDEEGMMMMDFSSAAANEDGFKRRPTSTTASGRGGGGGGPPHSSMVVVDIDEEVTSHHHPPPPHHHPMSTTTLEDFSSLRVKLLCSFDGKILPRPGDGRLRYVGGETRIITVNRDISYAELVFKVTEICGYALTLKYQLPDEDLDALVSVSSNEDLENMMEEYDKLRGFDGFSRLRVFLFPAVEYDVTHLSDDSVGDQRNPDQRYVDAVNGVPKTGSRKHSETGGVGVPSIHSDNLIGLDVVDLWSATSVSTGLLVPQTSQDVASLIHAPLSSLPLSVSSIHMNADVPSAPSSALSSPPLIPRVSKQSAIPDLHFQFYPEANSKVDSSSHQYNVLQQDRFKYQDTDGYGSTTRSSSVATHSVRHQNPEVSMLSESPTKLRQEGLQVGNHQEPAQCGESPPRRVAEGRVPNVPASHGLTRMSEQQSEGARLHELLYRKPEVTRLPESPSKLGNRQEHLLRDEPWRLAEGRVPGVVVVPSSHDLTHLSEQHVESAASSRPDSQQQLDAALLQLDPPQQQQQQHQQHLVLQQQRQQQLTQAAGWPYSLEADQEHYNRRRVDLYQVTPDLVIKPTTMMDPQQTFQQQQQQQQHVRTGLSAPATTKVGYYPVEYQQQPQEDVFSIPFMSQSMATPTLPPPIGSDPSSPRFSFRESGRHPGGRQQQQQQQQQQQSQEAGYHHHHHPIEYQQPQEEVFSMPFMNRSVAKHILPSSPIGSSPSSPRYSFRESGRHAAGGAQQQQQQQRQQSQQVHQGGGSNGLSDYVDQQYAAAGVLHHPTTTDPPPSRSFHPSASAHFGDRLVHSEERLMRPTLLQQPAHVSSDWPLPHEQHMYEPSPLSQTRFSDPVTRSQIPHYTGSNPFQDDLADYEVEYYDTVQAGQQPFQAEDIQASNSVQQQQQHFHPQHSNSKTNYQDAVLPVVLPAPKKLPIHSQYQDWPENVPDWGVQQQGSDMDDTWVMEAGRERSQLDYLEEDASAADIRVTHAMEASRSGGGCYPHLPEDADALLATSPAEPFQQMKVDWADPLGNSNLHSRPPSVPQSNVMSGYSPALGRVATFTDGSSKASSPYVGGQGSNDPDFLALLPPPRCADSSTTQDLRSTSSFLDVCGSHLPPLIPSAEMQSASSGAPLVEDRATPIGFKQMATSSHPLSTGDIQWGGGFIGSDDAEGDGIGMFGTSSAAQLQSGGSVFSGGQGEPSRPRIGNNIIDSAEEEPRKGVQVSSDEMQRKAGRGISDDEDVMHTLYGLQNLLLDDRPLHKVQLPLSTMELHATLPPPPTVFSNQSATPLERRKNDLSEDGKGTWLHDFQAPFISSPIFGLQSWEENLANLGTEFDGVSLQQESLNDADHVPEEAIFEKIEVKDQHFVVDGLVEHQNQARLDLSKEVRKLESYFGNSASDAEAEAISRGLQTVKNDDLEELRELGSGTYGTVYHGKWRGTDVAIKRIRASCFAGQPSEKERLIADFWKEACTLSQLHHPNVVAFYGVVRDGPGGTLATVTEYMVNGSLKQVLQKNDRTIDRHKRLLLATDAAFGMEYLHEKNIVHFDLKCENLLVNMRDPQRPICKVGDLGLSKVKQQTMVSGGIRGTLPWMAPELLNSTSNMVTEKVDVFSFGIVMWELLTGEEPYANLHYGAIIGGIVNNTLRPKVPTWCDPSWKLLMERCWASEPVDRPGFTEIASNLRAMMAATHPKAQDNR